VLLLLFSLAFQGLPKQLDKLLSCESQIILTIPIYATLSRGMIHLVGEIKGRGIGLGVLIADW